MRHGRTRRGGTVGLAALLLAAGTLGLSGTAQAATRDATVATGGAGLNVRTAPSTGAAKIATLRNRSRVPLQCQEVGQRVAGTVRTTRLWNRLPDGSYVSDAYVNRGAAPVPRCAAEPAAVLAEPATAAVQAAADTPVVATGGTPLNVRAAASGSAARRSVLPNGTPIRIVCQRAGEQVSGPVRNTNLWNELPDGSYVSDGYVRRGATPLHRCEQMASIPMVNPAGTWLMPVPSVVGSAFRSASRPTHDGVDLSVPRDTPILAAGEGKVIRVVCNASTGNCNVDGSPQVSGCGWYVEIQHAGRVVTRYCHLIRRPVVQVGQWVRTGQLIGHVGSSGNSSGPHLHFEIHVNAAPADRSNAVNPVTFLRARNVPIG